MTARGLLWQLADSAFPTGGFAHSFGLEAARAAGLVAGEAALSRFVRDLVWQTGYAALPFVTAAHRAPGDLAGLDRTCDLSLVGRTPNRASRTQGRALLDVCGRVWPELGALGRAREYARAQGLGPHFAPAAGVALTALGVGENEARQLVLFWALRGALSAAVRLGLSGPHAAQRLLADLTPLLDDVERACGGLTPDERAQTSPLADLVAATHHRLYSRLFQS